MGQTTVQIHICFLFFFLEFGYSRLSHQADDTGNEKILLF